MKTEIIFPKNNEEAFIEIAKKLGTKELVIVYPFPKKKEFTSSKVKIKTALIATAAQLKGGNTDTANIIVQSDPQKDRWIIEKIKPKMIFGFEFQERKDFLHHRNSAINHITAKIMAKNNIAYGFPVSELISAPKWKQPIILGRMQQNITLCKKYKVEIIIASFATNPMLMRSMKDIKALL
jgi:RNase P/RNase MRP subunit p30